MIKKLSDFVTPDLSNIERYYEYDETMNAVKNHIYPIIGTDSLSQKIWFKLDGAIEDGHISNTENVFIIGSEKSGFSIENSGGPFDTLEKALSDSNCQSELYALRILNTDQGISFKDYIIALQSLQDKGFGYYDYREDKIAIDGEKQEYYAVVRNVDVIDHLIECKLENIPESMTVCREGIKFEGNLIVSMSKEDKDEAVSKIARLSGLKSLQVLAGYDDDGETYNFKFEKETGKKDKKQSSSLGFN